MFFALAHIILGYITVLGLIDASPVSNTLPNPIQTLRQGYTYTPGIGSHKVHTRLANWNTARRTCDEEGAHLGIINSVAEANAVIQLFNQSNAGQVYVGLHDFYQEYEFVTIHGESVVQTGFNEWRTGEPNNVGNNEHCVVLIASGTFNDVDCTTRNYFVCELPGIQSQPQVSR